MSKDRKSITNEESITNYESSITSEDDQFVIRNSIIPAFRFPEFKNEGEWEERKLSEILIEGKLGGNYENIESDGGIPIIKMGNIDRGKISLGKVQYLPQDSFYNDDDILKSGDLLLNTRNTLELVGKVAIWRNELPIALYNSNLIRMTFNQKYIASNFYMNYFFNTQAGLKKLKSIATGTTSVAAIYTKDLLEIEISFPPNLPEQQKISSCLSSLDEVISAQSQKMDLLKHHKKGLMQNLFPNSITNYESSITSEDDQFLIRNLPTRNLPKYRFKEFEKDGKWVEEKLEDLAKRGSGHTPNKQVADNYNGGIKWVSLADSNKLDNGYIYDTKIQISQKGIKNSSAVLHPAGTVILSRDAGVGKSAVLNTEMAVSQHFIAWDCYKSKLSNWFFYYVLQILKSTFESIAVGSTIKTIGLPYFKELCICIPPTIKEQQKIASCLSSLDALITAQAEKIEQLKLHKKGLMQGLFPKITE